MFMFWFVFWLVYLSLIGIFVALLWIGYNVQVIASLMDEDVGVSCHDDDNVVHFFPHGDDAA